MALTTAQLFGLIIAVVVIVLIVLVIVNPALLVGGWGNQLWNFNDFCIVWGKNYYQPGLNGIIQIKVPRDDGGYDLKRYNITEYCSGGLGKNPSVLTNSDIENCRDLCKR